MGFFLGYRVKEIEIKFNKNDLFNKIDIFDIIKMVINIFYFKLFFIKNICFLTLRVFVKW